MKVFKKILIIAGEASGDLHAAKLVRDVHALDASIHFFGMGGKGLQEAGVDVLVNSDDLAVMGLFDVLFKLPKIFIVMKKLRRALLRNRPDLVILVDYPGFNLRFAKIAKHAGCKVLYYISPKLWASREGRIKAVQKYVDHMAVIFPFEVDFYRKHGVSVSYVGNPLTETLHTTMSCEVARESFDVSVDEKVVGLFPGSRKAEIKRMLPVILRAAERIKKQLPEVKFLLPVAPSLSRDYLQPYIDKSTVEVKVLDSCLRACLESRGLSEKVDNRDKICEGVRRILGIFNKQLRKFYPVSRFCSKSIDFKQALKGASKQCNAVLDKRAVSRGALNDLMQVCDATIAVSGTITLQLALMQIPMVIIYKISPSFMSFGWLLKIPDIGLCNIVAGRRVVRELWQRKANPEAISAEIVKILQDDAYRNRIIDDLNSVADRVSPDHKIDLARLVVDCLRPSVFGVKS